MRCILQRVHSASVVVEEKVVGEIGKGIIAFVGTTHGDTMENSGKWLVNRLLKARLWPGDDGKPWRKNVTDIEGGVLVVSQFTLYGIMKGTKPDFHGAQSGGEAEGLLEEVVAALKAEYREDKISTGNFGAMMTVNAEGDGPVTLIFDSENPKLKPPATPTPSSAAAGGGGRGE